MADNAAGAPFRARQPHLLDKGGEPMYCPLKPDMALCNPNCAWYTGTPDGVCPECAIYTIAQKPRRVPGNPEGLGKGRRRDFLEHLHPRNAVARRFRQRVATAVLPRSFAKKGRKIPGPAAALDFPPALFTADGNTVIFTAENQIVHIRTGILEHLHPPFSFLINIMIRPET